MQTSQVNEMQVMDMNIRALNFALSLAQYEYVERRLSYALDTSAEQICAVDVWLSELHDTSSARNQRCLVEVTLSDAGQVVIDSVEADLYVAVHRAADRASWEVARCHGRSKVRARAQLQASLYTADTGSQMQHQQSIM